MLTVTVPQPTAAHPRLVEATADAADGDVEEPSVAPPPAVADEDAVAQPVAPRLEQHPLLPPLPPLPLLLPNLHESKRFLVMYNCSVD